MVRPDSFYTERYAHTKYDVIYRSTHCHRIGHITGSKDTWLAEMGPVSLGYFPTKKAALLAIKEHYTAISVQDYVARQGFDPDDLPYSPLRPEWASFPIVQAIQEWERLTGHNYELQP